MAYNKTTWENAPSTNTPINASNLNKIEEGIYSNSLKAEQVGDLSTLTTTAKNNLVSSINEINNSKQEKFVIEVKTIATSVTINYGDTIAYTVPDKTGYTGYVLKPYVAGAWSDKYAVYVPYNKINGFGIRNDHPTIAYTWDIYCAVLYIKNEE